MTNLVRLTTQDISKAKPVASTRIIAEEFRKRHADVIRKVELLVSDDSSTFFTERKIAFSEYEDESGKLNKEYLLNRDQFIFIVMGFTGSKATKMKEMFINQFNSMERELLVRENTRSIGKSVRRSLTDSIDDNLEDNTSHKAFAFSNYTKLIYKKVLGMTVKKYKAELKIKDSENVRDNLTADQLSEVQALESKIAILLEGFTSVMTDKETYAKIKELI